MLDHCLDMLCHLAAKTGQGRELLADMIALRREQEEHGTNTIKRESYGTPAEKRDEIHPVQVQSTGE